MLRTFVLVVLWNLIFNSLSADPLIQTTDLSLNSGNVPTSLIRINEQSLDLSKHDYIKDDTGRLTIADVSNSPRAFTQGSPTGFMDSVVWLRFQVDTHKQSIDGWILDLAFFPIAQADLFHRSSESIAWQHQMLSDQIPLNQRELSHNNIAFRLRVDQPGLETFYLRIKPMGSLQSALVLYSPKAWAAKQKYQNYGFGLYFGLMLAMILYNFFLYLSIQDKNYLYYVFSISAFSLFVMGMNGLAFEFLWPESPEWSLDSLLLFGGAAIFFSALFIRSFLQTHTYVPRLDWCLKALLILAPASVFASMFLPIHLAASFQSSIAAFQLIVTSYIAWLCLRQGFRPAKYLLFSSAALVLGITIFELHHVGVLDTSILTQLAMPLGSTLEMMFLSFALAARINLLKEEHLQAQNSAIDELNKNDSIREASLVREKKLSELKDSFLVRTSHELRTPLHGMIGLADALMIEESDTSRRRDLSMMVASGQRLSVMIDDILDHSQLSYDSIILNKRPVDLHNIVELVLVIQRPLADEKGLSLHNKIPRKLASVQADEDRLQQIFHNLVGNAIRYTSNGRIEITASENKDFLAIQVKDTGPGIETSQLEQIFKPYYQSEQGLRSQEGIGLGLSVSKQLVALHEGSISVESSLGEGSCFSFTLPTTALSKNESASNNQTSTEITLAEVEAEFHFDSTHQETHGRILLVDDDPVNLRVVINQLTPSGYDIVTAINGLDGLDVLEDEGPFDLVLLDIMMPQMNGIETCKEIRKQYNKSELPIIFLTAQQHNSDLVLGLSEGGNDYLNKPFSMQELVARVDTHFQVRKNYMELQANPELDQVKYNLAQSEKTRLDAFLLFTEIINTSFDGLCAFNGESNLSFISNHSLRLLGYTGDFEAHRQNQFNKPFDTFFSETDLNGFNESEQIWKTFGDWSIKLSQQIQLTPALEQPATHPLYADLFHWQQPAEAGWILLLSAESVQRLETDITNITATGSNTAGNNSEQTKPTRSRLEDKKRIQVLNTDPDIRLMLVNLLTGTIDCWQQETGLNKLDLANQSELWKVVLEKRGVFRARTMERHMTLKSLPKKPRWQEIMATATFVLEQTVDSEPIHQQHLEAKLQALQEVYL